MSARILPVLASYACMAFMAIQTAIGADATYEMTGNLQLGAFSIDPGKVLTSGHTTVSPDRAASLPPGDNPMAGHILTVFNESGSSQAVRAYLHIITDGTSRAFRGTNYDASATYTGAQQTISAGSSAFWTSNPLPAWQYFNTEGSSGASAAGSGDGTIHLRWIVKTSPGGVQVGDPLDFVVNVIDDTTASAAATTVVRSLTPATNNIWPWGGEPEDTAMFNSTFKVTDYRPGTHTVRLFKGTAPDQLIWGVGGPAATTFTYEGNEFGAHVQPLQFETWTEGDIGDTWTWNLDGVDQGTFIVNPNEGGIGPEGAYSIPDMYTVDAGAKFPGDPDEDDPDYEGPDADSDGQPGIIGSPDPDPEVYDPDTDPDPSGDDISKSDITDAVKAALNNPGGFGPTRIPGTTAGEYLENNGDEGNAFSDGEDGLAAKGGAARDGIGDVADGIEGFEAMQLPSGIPTGALGTQLTYAVDLPMIGPATIDLNPYSSYILIFRSFLLLVCSATFFFLAMKVLRMHSAT